MCSVKLFVSIIIIVLVFVFGYAEDINSDFRSANNENWKAVNPSESTLLKVDDQPIINDNIHAEFLVSPGDAFEDNIPRRRRPGRKRKRRPYNENGSYFTPNEPKPVRRPQTLQDDDHLLEEHWRGEAFPEGEIAYRRSGQNRRRLNPVYYEQETYQEDFKPTKDRKRLGEDRSTEKSLKNKSNRFSGEDTSSESGVKNSSSQEDDYSANESDESYRTNQKSYRKPYPTRRKSENDGSTTPDLKTLLKKSGGSLSLSEILQQKNLSLSDLLANKQNAISVLTESPEVLTTTPVYSERKIPPSAQRDEPSNRRYGSSESKESRKRLPPVKTTATNLAVEEDPLLRREHMNAQRKRLSNIRTDIENKSYNGVTHFDVITEATTERRIFVPSNPRKLPAEFLEPHIENLKSMRYETTHVWKSSSEEMIKPTESIPTTTMNLKDMIIKENGNGIVRNRLSLKPKLKLSKPETKLPITSHEIKQKTEPKPQNEPSVPQNAFAIDLKELFSLGEISKPTKSDEDEEGPLKISVNLNEMFKNETKPNQQNDFMKTSTIVSKFLDIPDTEMADSKLPSAKDEIMEIMNDENGRERLSKVLASRNMTFEELIALRERGSSQLHLADIFHNQTKEPEPKSDDVIVKVIKSDIFNSFPNFLTTVSPVNDIKINKIHRPFEPKPTVISSASTNIQKDSNGLSYFTSVIEINPTPIDNVLRESRKFNVPLVNTRQYPQLNFNSRIPAPTMETQGSGQQNSYPLTRSNLHPSFEANNSPTQEDKVTSDDASRIEDIDNSISDILNNEFKTDSDITYNLEEDRFDEDEHFQIPASVRSAIAASFGIIGSSIIIFLTIFIACKWRQKQRKLLRYNSSFQIRSPILDSRQLSAKHSLSPVMINMNSKCLKSHSFSSTDSSDSQKTQQDLWETLRKPLHR